MQILSYCLCWLLWSAWQSALSISPTKAVAAVVETVETAAAAAAVTEQQTRTRTEFPFASFFIWIQVEWNCWRREENICINVMAIRIPAAIAIISSNVAIPLWKKAAHSCRMA